jgi:hypothetical protein
MGNRKSRTVNPEDKNPQYPRDQEVADAIKEYGEVQTELVNKFKKLVENKESVFSNKKIFLKGESGDLFVSGVYDELKRQYENNDVWWEVEPEQLSFEKLLSNPAIKYYFWRLLLGRGIVYDIDELSKTIGKTIVFPGDEYKYKDRYIQFVDRREAQLKALEHITPIPKEIATIEESEVFACARSEVIESLKKIPEQSRPISLTSAFRPLGETAIGEFVDVHGVGDTTDEIGHWTGWAVDTGDGSQYTLLKGAGFVQDLIGLGEQWHWVPEEAVKLKKAGKLDYFGGLLSEKGFKRPRATMANALGSPTGEGRALGFLAGGPGGSGLGPAAALAGALSGRGAQAGAPAAPGGPGEGVNFKQYIDKVNVTNNGGFSTDALMAALEEAAQQGTAKVG